MLISFLPPKKYEILIGVNFGIKRVLIFQGQQISSGKNPVDLVLIAEKA
jgi:hypothetical protein